nr:MAG: hypothetical protein [Bacteriophage sp.]
METVFEVIGKDIRNGISSRTGEPYVIENLTLNFHGKAAKIRAPRDTKVNIGDSVRLGLGTVRGFGSAQIGAVVQEVIPQEKKGE